MKSTNNSLRVVRVACCITLACSSLYFASCKKGDNNTVVTPTPTSTTSVSEEDVADAVTAAMTMESSGMVSQTEDVAYYAKSTALPCGSNKDTILSGSSIPGALLTYYYNYACNTALVCTLGIPFSYKCDFDGRTTYSTARMSSDDSCKGNFTVTGLQPPASKYVLNLSYVRNGTQTSKVRKKTTFTSVINVTGTDIAVDKASMIIVSGSASVVVTGTVTGGATYSKTATITFHGSKTATLTFSGGASYPLSW